MFLKWEQNSVAYILSKLLITLECFLFDVFVTCWLKRSFSSGGEDGYVRLHHFDPDYFNIKI